MRKIIVIADNIRSTHNVGSLLRTADGLGVERVLLCGITPYPKQAEDPRLPHLADKLDRQIEKTALGASRTVQWEYYEQIQDVLENLQIHGYTVVALEQADNSVPLNTYQPKEKVALLIGNEVDGIKPETLALVDTILEIPMFGSKESFNVVQAAAMALYHLRFT